MENTSLRFSILSFGPILILLAPPAIILFTMSMLTTILVIFDPDAALSSALSVGIWSLIPLILIFTVTITGRWIYRLRRNGISPRVFQLMLWITFSIFFFLTCWLDLTLLGSISASDKPALDYLGRTALGGWVITLIAQAGILPWLSFVFKRFPELFKPDRKSRRPA